MDDKTITCLMLYYGRKNLAEESMESFLRQKWPHKKLLIINDHPDSVYFETEYPDVQVHNLSPDTFKSLNDKYRYALEQVESNWWSPWDSDDIWLPWHLENLANHIDKTKRNHWPRKIGIAQSYFMFGKQKEIKKGWQMWGDCIWETFDNNGKHHAKCDPDSMENCDKQIIFQDWDRYWIPKDSPISFIFRWSTNEIEHRSALLGPEGLSREEKIRAKMMKKELKEPWHPHWDSDYIEMTRGEIETYNHIS